MAAVIPKDESNGALWDKGSDCGMTIQTLGTVVLIAAAAVFLIIVHEEDLHSQEILAVIAMTTCFMWIPYMAAFIILGGTKENRLAGLWTELFYRERDISKMPAWAKRAVGAHGNAVENLAAIAVAILVGQGRVAEDDLQDIAFAYLCVRVIHYVFMVAPFGAPLPLPAVKTLAFIAGSVITIILLGKVLDSDMVDSYKKD